jgi:hypothetical protein
MSQRAHEPAPAGATCPIDLEAGWPSGCPRNRLFRGVGEASKKTRSCGMVDGSGGPVCLMPAQPFVPDPYRLHLLSLSADSARISLQMRTWSDSAPCPQCGRRSTRVHARYRRTLIDVPWRICPGQEYPPAWSCGPGVSFVTRQTALAASLRNGSQASPDPMHAARSASRRGWCI